MTDQNAQQTTSPAGNGNGPQRHCRSGGPRRRGLAVAAVVVATGLVGFGIGKATGGGHFGHRFGMHRTMDADTLIRQADTGVGRVLGKVDATAEQKTKVGEITKAALKDLLPLRDSHSAVRDKLAAALKAEKIDRGVIEQLRVDELALAETLSKRAAQALAEIAEVLTPAQRTKLVERWQSRTAGRG